jgi:hypothetical protein
VQENSKTMFFLVFQSSQMYAMISYLKIDYKVFFFGKKVVQLPRNPCGGNNGLYDG